MATPFWACDMAIHPQVRDVFYHRLQRLHGTEFMMRLATQIVPCSLTRRVSLSAMSQANAAKIAYF